MRGTILGLAICLVALWLTWLVAPAAQAQLGGSRAGVEQNSPTVDHLPVLSRDVAEGFITVDGRAELRLRPTEIRVVLAVTSEGKTAQECQAAIEQTIGKLKEAWTGMGIAGESIVVDFIAVLPVYEWTLEKRGATEVGLEKKAGFRMQTNVHLAVSNDAKAPQALTKAFEQGVTDIIAFDYFSQQLDEVKAKAREQAVKAARGKADVLLAALFDPRPPAINVQEQTTVRYPESLYHSFVNAHEDELLPSYRREMPLIRAYRPRNTYYRGLLSDGDIQPRELPMHPEISVVSTVRLYYESPAAKRGKRE